MKKKILFPILFNIPMLLFSASQMVSAENPAPFFSSGMWPGEGGPRFKAKTNLQGLVEPRSGAAEVKGLVLKKGNTFEFTETEFQTLRPAEVVLTQGTTLKVSDYGNVRYLSRDAYYSSGKTTQLQLNAGDRIQVLQYRAEGEYLFQVGAHVYGGPCPPCEGSSYTTAWWVKTNEGERSGWILINEDNVEFLPREF